MLSQKSKYNQDQKLTQKLRYDHVMLSQNSTKDLHRSAFLKISTFIYVGSFQNLVLESNILLIASNKIKTNILKDFKHLIDSKIRYYSNSKFKFIFIYESFPTLLKFNMYERFSNLFSEGYILNCFQIEI